MDPTTNPMKEEKEIINPLRHKYYSIIRDMYHPFLYDNYSYCEMSEERLLEILEERDIYVKTIRINVMDALLTDQERDWVHFLRNCCLFEVHRRKFKLVLNDMMAYVRRYEDSQLTTDYEVTPYYKVWQWLRRYLDSPRYEPDEEDLEYQKINNQPVISFDHPVRQIREEIQRRGVIPLPAHSSRQEVVCQVLFQRVGPAPSEPTDDYYAGFESAEGSVATSVEEMGDGSEGMGSAILVQEPVAQPVSDKYQKDVAVTAEKEGPTNTIREKDEIEYAICENYKINRASRDIDITARAPSENNGTARAATEDDKKARTAAPASDESARTAPEQRDEACVAPKKDVTADIAAEEVHLVQQNDEPAALPPDTEHSDPNAPASGPKELVLYEDYPRDFFYAHPELFEIHTVESLGKLMSDREYIKEREGRKEELEEMARKREIALAEYYAKKAKESDAPKETVSACGSEVTYTIDDVDDNLLQSTSSTISQMSFNEPQPSSYTSDTQMRSVSDYHLELKRASGSFCSTTTVVPSTSHDTNDSQTTSIADYNDYLALPSAPSSTDDVNMPSASNYNNEGAIRKQYYNKNKVSTRAATPPPVPDFFPSSKGSVTMDSSDFRELESDNTYYLWYLKETGQMTENDPDEPEEHPELPRIDLAGSEEEIDCTLPPIEPDFTNLPLPEIPDQND